MIDQLLQQLRETVAAAEGLSDETKADLLGHLDAMDRQVTSSAHGPSDSPAESAAPTSEEETGLQKLVASVEELEASHPDITVLVTRLATILGNAGV